MSMSNKEIALEITKAYLNHLSERAKTTKIEKSHASPDDVCAMYKKFYKSVSSSDDKSSDIKE